MKFRLLSLVVAFTLATFSVNAQDNDFGSDEALKAMTRGDFRGAIVLLDKEIAANPNKFAAYRARAEVKQMIGDFSGALADTNKAISLKPDDGRLYESRSKLRIFTGGGNAEILQDLDLAIANGIKHDKVYNSRGLYRSIMGDHAGALADYEVAVGLNPTSPRGYLGLSSAYRAKGDDAKSLEILESYVLNLENANKKIPSVKKEVTGGAYVELPVPNAKDVRIGQEVLIYKSERLTGPMTPEMAQAMSDRLENTKNNAAIYFNLAQAYERAGRYPLALETVEKGLAIDRLHYGYGVRGNIRVRLKDYAGAIEDLTRAISSSGPNRADYFLSRGLAFLALGKAAESEEDLARSLELFPNGKAKLEERKKEILESLP